MAPMNLVAILTIVVLLKIAGEYMLHVVDNDNHHRQRRGVRHVASSTVPPTPSPPRPRSNVTTPGVPAELPSLLHADGGKADVVFSYFYFRKGWYLTRSIPPLQWGRVFLRSLHAHRRTASNGGRPLKVVLWVDVHTGVELLKDIQKMGLNEGEKDFITLVPFDWEERFPGMRWANMTLLRNSAGSYRYDLYRTYLEQHLGEVNRVLMSDLTDVAFQGNPFDVCFPDGGADGKPTVLFTYESATKNFGNEVHNRRWMRCYPRDVLHALKKKSIGNSGVTFGTASGALQYTKLILEQIVSLTECCINIIHTSNDQASLNYILHYQTHNHTEFHPTTVNMAHPCVFHGNFAKLSINNNSVTTPSGEPYGIVHQFTSDRHPPAMELMKRLYGEG